VLPVRMSTALRQLSAAFTQLGNQWVYHDLEGNYKVSSASAIAFPEELRQQFSAAVVDRGFSILYRSSEWYRTTKIPKSFADLGGSTPQQSINTTVCEFRGWKHVLLIPTKRRRDVKKITFSDDYVTTDVMVFPIPSGPDLEPHLYCLLLSFIQPSFGPGENREIEEIEATLKEKYPKHYSKFFDGDTAPRPPFLSPRM